MRTHTENRSAVLSDTVTSITQQEVSGFEFIVSTMPGFPDIGLLQAAARAGAIAILNLEAIRELADVETAVTALIRWKVGRVGVRVDCVSSLELLATETLESLDVVVLRPEVLHQAPDVVKTLQSLGRRVLLECTTIDEAKVGADLRLDGVIAKGHEAGGRVGEETTLVLLQRLLDDGAMPVFAHGGIGVHTVAACFVAGCAGAVLDAQVLLARESSLPEPIKRAVARMTGDETLCLGAELGERYRVYRRPGLHALQELQRLEVELGGDDTPERERRTRWQAALRDRVNWRLDRSPLWPLGQDAALASALSHQFRSMAGILSGLRESIETHVDLARDLHPLDEGSPLARAHGTRYPILQGPMTRVSDVAGFAAAVADGGALPFLALALLRAPKVRAASGKRRSGCWTIAPGASASSASFHWSSARNS